MNSIKAEIEAATTKEQMKAIAKNLREKRGSLEHLVRVHGGRAVLSSVEGIINRASVLEKKLENILAKAEENGITVDVEAEMTSFSGSIAKAKDKTNQAKAKIEEAQKLRESESGNKEGVKALTDEAKQLLKEARDAIKEGHSTLKTIVKKIKEAYPQADISASVEVEVAQDTSGAQAST